MIEIRNLSQRFAGPRGWVEALHNVNLTIPAGEVFGIIGRSGAGKSTLVRTINLLTRPSEGSVIVDGRDLTTLPAPELRAARRDIGMIFQHFNLLSSRTVFDNVALPLELAGMKRAEIEATVLPLLDLVGLTTQKDRYPAQISGGQKQRVGIARALVHDPDLLLCDEATSALDPETTQQILALLRDINRRLGLTIVLITHEMAVIREVCDSVAVIEAGEVVETGAVWRVFGDPRHGATQALLRTLVHDLPADLAARLDSVPHDHADVLLDVRYTGESRHEPDLGALAVALGALGGRVNFVHGGIDRIQGHAQGRLVVSAQLRASGADQAGLRAHVDALVAGARRHADKVEVLGYV
jgi:D-methionine transport system ATP-binding protein